MKKIALIMITLFVNVQGTEPKIVFDNRPESGIPPEALAQEFAEGVNRSKSFFEMTNGTIKTVRIRYFNQETWKNEEEACEYVRGYFSQKVLQADTHRKWSQAVLVPEIECFVEFTDEYKSKLSQERQGGHDGRLLIWHTASCFRDASGKWWFVNTFEHFHAAHPKGDRKLSRTANPN